jgi:hypothetical protein
MHNGLMGGRLSIGIWDLSKPSYSIKYIGYIFIESIDILELLLAV